MKHTIDELKQKVDRLQMNVEAKEQHIGRLQQENKQARRNYINMGQKTDNTTSAMVGSNLMNKLNFTGVANSTSGGSAGYQPRMYGQRLGNDSITDGG